MLPLGGVPSTLGNDGLTGGEFEKSWVLVRWGTTRQMLGLLRLRAQYEASYMTAGSSGPVGQDTLTGESR